MSRKPQSIAAILFSALAASHGIEPLYWYYYDVDTTGDFAKYSSIAYDSEGHLSLGYRGGRSIKYSRFDGKTWSREVVDTSTAVGAQMSMAVDSKGSPHIFFEDADDARILYARIVDGKWTRSMIDSSGHGSYYQVTAAAGPGDTIHAIYNKHVGGGVELTYSKVVNGASTPGVALCDKCGYAGKWNDLVIDSLGRPVASYFWDFPRNLTLGLYNADSSKWTKIGLDQYLDLALEGYHNSLAKDTGGSFYIATQNPKVNTLLLLHGRPGDSAKYWKMEKVDTLTGFNVFGNRSHVEMMDGEPRLFYSRMSDTDPNQNKIGQSDLVMAYKEGGEWKYVDIDTAGITGTFSSVAISPDGLPALSYAEIGKGWLKVAIASRTPPPDENNNGIPDYKEVSAVRKPGSALRLKRDGADAKRYDSRGRVLPSRRPGHRAPAVPTFLSPR